MKFYKVSCLQSNGKVYAPRMKGFSYRKAMQRLKENREVFKCCKDWKLVEVDLNGFEIVDELRISK